MAIGKYSMCKWCVPIFLIEKYLGFQSEQAQRMPNCHKLPTCGWFSSSWFPQRYYWWYVTNCKVNDARCSSQVGPTTNSSLPASCHEWLAVLALDLCKWHTNFHCFWCTHPSNHAILVVWVYFKGSNPRWRCRSASVCTCLVADPHESRFPMWNAVSPQEQIQHWARGKPELGGSEPFYVRMFDSSSTCAKRHAHKIAYSYYDYLKEKKRTRNKNRTCAICS